MQIRKASVRAACATALLTAPGLVALGLSLSTSAQPSARPASQARLGRPAAATLLSDLRDRTTVQSGQHRSAPAAVHSPTRVTAAHAAAVSPRTGILPPHNPPANIAPDPDFLADCTPGAIVDDSTTCLSTTLEAVNHARATEPVGAMSISIAGLQHLTVPEQIFAITDLERVARGLPPIADLTSQLDSVAAVGADTDTDPLLGATPPAGGGSFESWGSNWAGGTYNALVSDYYWMYDDGYGSSNLACTTPTSPGCWGHRDNILGTFLFSGVCGGAQTLVMGAAYTVSPTGGVTPSFAEILAGQCGTPTGVVFTWAEAEHALLPTPAPAPAPKVIGIAPTANGGGYWIANSAGKVWNLGDAAPLGDLSHLHLAAPIVGIAADPAGRGFWLVASDGGVFGIGAPFLGSEGGHHLNKPIVGIAAAPNGHGYWLVASDGGIFAFGDAHFKGSMGAHHLNQPIVGMAADPRTGGYWMVAGDGGIFSFDAPFYGSEGAHHLNGRIVGMSVAAGGTGYRFVAADGGIFTFHAPFYGSEGAAHSAPIAGMATDAGTGGYWLVADNGGVFSFRASSHGSA